MVKKIHAVLTLLLCLLLLLHLVITGLLMSTLVPMHLCFLLLANVLMFVLIAHLVLTLFLMLLNYDRNRKKLYIKLNWRCYTQRITGIAVLVLTPSHLAVFIHENPPWVIKMARALASPLQSVTPPKPVIIPHIFYFVALIGLVLFCCFHVSVSIPKALVGLGLIVEEKALARVEKICFVCVYAIGAFTIWGTCMLGHFSGLFGGAA